MILFIKSHFNSKSVFIYCIFSVLDINPSPTEWLMLMKFFYINLFEVLKVSFKHNNDEIINNFVLVNTIFFLTIFSYKFMIFGC